ncbi:terminase [Pseudomonas helleri]|uniref:terminase large subunit n=1 Tax=Pseudomonas helleri TaxID=1608996 RepID=UPI0006529D80|nr:terminase TerL endonuclease subunit [Pseudomonas helleri]KMN21772.1 terminase [Pseudomonas helleri]
MANVSVNAANRYARNVVAGKIEACKWVRLACKRHLDDLEASKSRNFKWKFNKAEAERVCAFVQALPHTKGKWARERRLLKLEPWQMFIFCCVFGWVSKKSGLRRFREVYCEIPRKNGKSVIAAGVALFMLCADGEFGAEVYCGATTEKQAWEVFRPARLMMLKTPDLVEAAGVEINARSLAMPDDGSRLEPIIGDPGDGSSPSCSLVDEYHEHESDALYETMLTGMGSREQALIFTITTAGSNIAGPCYEKRKQICAMLENVVANDELFGLIYTLDEQDDWRSLQALKKANPNYGVSIYPENLQRSLADATRYPSRQNAFKTKHCNLWVNAKKAWLNQLDWDRAKDSSLSLDDMLGIRCYLGVDLASKCDIADIAIVFREKDEDGRDIWSFFNRHYLPEGAVQADSPNQEAYERWVNEGNLITTDGEELDFDVIREDVKAIGGDHQVEEVAYDKWRATQLAHQLMKDGAEVIEVGGGIQTMNLAMRELEAALVSGRVRHNGDPVLGWMASNVVAHEYKGCITPTKESSAKKIDGMVAILMAMSRALLADGVMPSVLETLEDDDFLVG